MAYKGAIIRTSNIIKRMKKESTLRYLFNLTQSNTKNRKLNTKARKFRNNNYFKKAFTSLLINRFIQQKHKLAFLTINIRKQAKFMNLWKEEHLTLQARKTVAPLVNFHLITKALYALRENHRI